MFISVNKKQLLHTLKQLQGFHCCYSIDGGPTSFCDCKYGGKHLDGRTRSGGEDTGCPELRVAEYIISQLTDEEYDKLIQGKKVRKCKS